MRAQRGREHTQVEKAKKVPSIEVKRGGTPVGACSTTTQKLGNARRLQKAEDCRTGYSGQQWGRRWEGANLECGRGQLIVISEPSVVSTLTKS